jgi:hypothetical protein
MVVVMASVVENLKAARALIEKPEHFAQGTYAQKQDAVNGYRYACDVEDPRASCFCSLGALRRILGDEVDHRDAFGLEGHWLASAARELFPLKAEKHASFISLAIIPDVNDNIGHEGVLQMFDRAIALAEREAEVHP